MTFPTTVNIIDFAPAPFNCARDAIAYAKSHGIVGVMSNADKNQPTKAYSYEITNVEVLRGNAAPVARPSNNTSTFAASILLRGVCDVNGVPLLANEKPEAQA